MLFKIINVLLLQDEWTCSTLENDTIQGAKSLFYHTHVHRPTCSCVVRRIRTEMSRSNYYRHGWQYRQLRRPKWTGESIATAEPTRLPSSGRCNHADLISNALMDFQHGRQLMATSSTLPLVETSWTNCTRLSFRFVSLNVHRVFNSLFLTGILMQVTARGLTTDRWVACQLHISKCQPFL